MYCYHSDKSENKKNEGIQNYRAMVMSQGSHTALFIHGK